MSEGVPALHQWEQITCLNEPAPALMASWGWAIPSPLIALCDAPSVEVSEVDELTLWSEDPPARTSQWLDAVQDWAVSGAACSGTSAASLVNSLPAGFCGRTSLVLCPATAARTSPPCCGDSPDADLPCPRTGGARSACASVLNGPPSGGCLTLDGSEWPNDAAVCSLSRVLEPTVDSRYSLTPRAATGILERARRRGRRVPAHLEAALTLIAEASSSAH
jgi:hypothetical protein